MKPLIMNFHHSLSVFLPFFFQVGGKGGPTVPEVERTDTSTTFLIKKVYFKIKGEAKTRVTDSRGRVFSDMFVACLPH